MRIAVLGTGPVGRTIADRLAELKHDVYVGTRDPAETLKRTGQDMFGNPPFKVWRERHAAVGFGTFAQAAAHGELVFNCTAGGAAIEALKAAGAQNLRGKILIDVSNPLDFSKGRPPMSLFRGDDSVAEQIQRAFPDAKVVKTLNTINALVMVIPGRVKGEHDVFLSGNDSAAKARVTELLRSFGWKSVVDLGDITTARGTEAYVLLWVRLWGALQTPDFNVKVVR